MSADLLSMRESMIRRLGVGLTVLALMFLGFAGAPSAGADGSDIGWTSVCNYSHSLMDDPIVYPGQPGVSHLHDFYGNTTTDAYSTIASLLAAGTTTCKNLGETAAYWVPALMYNDVLKTAPVATIYYRSSTTPVAAIQPIPPGLVMIAGDSHATGDQPLSVVGWSCGAGVSYPEAPNCGSTVDLALTVRFPSCWDGVNLDSADHKSHMAYPVTDVYGNSTCPVDHPVSVPKIAINLHYVGVHDGTKVTLMSGPTYTAHADFMNAWDPATMADLTTRCINAGINCDVADVLGPQMTFTQKPANPTTSTSASFAFYPNEATSGPYTCALDANPGVDCSNGTFNAVSLANGLHTLNITATDLLGNVGLTAYSWTVDLVAPVVTVTGGFPSGWSKVNTATFHLSSSEPAVTYTCQLDANPIASCTTQPTYGGLFDGPHTFTAWATDPVGNKSAPASQTWVQDRVLPILTVTGGPPNGSLTNSRSGSISLSSNEAGSTFKCARDSSPFAPCPSPYTWSGLWDGLHTLSAYAVDPAGNNSKTWSVSWTIDTIKPMVSITSGPGNQTASTTATFTFTGTDLHTVTFTCQFDGGSVQSSCRSPKSYTGLSLGSHTFALVGTDAAGNANTRIYTWVIVAPRR